MKTITAFLGTLALLASVPGLAQTKPVNHAAAKPAIAKHTVAARPVPAAHSPTSRTAGKPGGLPPRPVPTTPQAPPPATAAPAASSTASAPASASTSAAAGELFRKGTTMVNLGVGVGLGYGYYGTIKSTPAVSLSVEHGFLDGVGPGTIGIGGLVGYKGYHYDYPGSGYKATWTNIIVAARGTYHYNILENPKLDTYAGISLGVRLQTWKDTYYDSAQLNGYSASSSYVTSGIFVGARYFVTDALGAFTEVGYDMNYLKLGLTGKF